MNKEKLAKKLLKDAKQRAKNYSIEFNITLEDIIIPDYCYILGIPLFSNALHSGPNSPSLDRINPDNGYTKGNVQVISHKANTMKSNANLDELQAFAMWVIRQGVVCKTEIDRCLRTIHND